MKHIITIAAVACAFALHAAHVQTLKPGLNSVDAYGEIVGIEANTVSASQSVTAAVVTVVSEYTNRVQNVSAPHMVYSFTVTNYDGRASVSTNVWDSFSYADWMTTNGVSKIVGSVAQSRTNVTETVVIGKALKARYTHETAIGNGNASSHYLKFTPASTTYFFGGQVRLQCADGDNVKILIK